MERGEWGGEIEMAMTTSPTLSPDGIDKKCFEPSAWLGRARDACCTAAPEFGELHSANGKLSPQDGYPDNTANPSVVLSNIKTTNSASPFFVAQVACEPHLPEVRRSEKLQSQYLSYIKNSPRCH
jgi:hypothetical protein